MGFGAAYFEVSLPALFALLFYERFQVLSPEVVCGNHGERQDLKLVSYRRPPTRKGL